MRKVIKLIDLDCAHCAEKIQRAVGKIDGVTHAEVNFLGQKMVVEAEESQWEAIAEQAVKIVKKIEPDVTVKL